MTDPLPPSLLDAAAAAEALDRAAPLLEALARDRGVNGSGVLHVVVLDPASSPLAPAEVLAERSFGERPPSEWDADYAAFARAKAQLSWRCRCDSHAVLSLQPQALRVGDSALWGGVYLDGLVVAVSGCEMPYDEAAAGAVALLLRARAKLRMAVENGPTVCAALVTAAAAATSRL